MPFGRARIEKKIEKGCMNHQDRLNREKVNSKLLFEKNVKHVKSNVICPHQKGL